MVCAFGISRAGAALVPLNPTYTDHELSYILTDADVQLVFCRSNLTERLWAIRPNLPSLRTIESIDSIESLELLLSGVSDRPIQRAGHVSSDRATLWRCEFIERYGSSRIQTLALPTSRGRVCAPAGSLCHFPANRSYLCRPSLPALTNLLHEWCHRQ